MFRCLVVRHGEAEASAASGADADRGLSASGGEELARACRGLARISRRPEVIAFSPYERARASAAILAAAFGEPAIAVEPIDALAAGASPEPLLAWLGSRRGRLVALVGHEPDLGRFVSLALADSKRSFYPMHVGDACLLEFPTVPRPGNATLEWAIERSQLALIADAVDASARPT